MRLILLLVLIVVTGCSTSRLSDRELFLRTVGHERHNYRELYQISVESLTRQQDQLRRRSSGMIQVLREASQQCTNDCAAVQKELNRIERIAQAFYDTEVRLIDELRTAYKAESDTAFYYDYKSTKVHEVGWAVVDNRGNIKKRVVLGRDDNLLNE